MDEAYLWLSVMSLHPDVLIEVNLLFRIPGSFHHFEAVLLGRSENLVDMLLH